MRPRYALPGRAAVREFIRSTAAAIGRAAARAWAEEQQDHALMTGAFLGLLLVAAIVIGATHTQPLP